MPQRVLESMSTRAQEALVAARELLEESGSTDGLTMRALADKLGIKAPSLYAHFRDKRAIENALVAWSLREQAAAARVAIDAVDDPQSLEGITALWGAYRRWAIDNASMFDLATARDIDRSDEAVAEAEWLTIEQVRRTTAGDREAGVAFWAFSYGMVELEIERRFPPGFDLEDAWRRGLVALSTSLKPPA